MVMTRTLEDCRIELLKQMDTYVRDTIGDDEILGLWLEEGLPDGCNEADLMEIALDDEEVKKFVDGKEIVKKIYVPERIFTIVAK